MPAGADVRRELALGCESFFSGLLKNVSNFFMFVLANNFTKVMFEVSSLGASRASALAF